MRTEKWRANWIRAYGSKARVKWMQNQRCVACDGWPSVNAHIKSPDEPPSGMGRKHDFKWIVPLCHKCHGELHSIGQRSFEDKHLIDLGLEAIVVFCKWRDMEHDDDDLAT